MNKKIFLAILSFAFIYGCSSLTLKPVDFSWPLENVLEIRADFNVTSMRYAVTLNLREIFQNEGMIKNNEPVVKKIRIIRNREGFYFITANKFKNVYVFKPGIASLELEKIITINNVGIEKPAFNQRNDYIELITENGKHKFKINQNGIIN